MACKKCGGGRTKLAVASSGQASVQASDVMVEMQYTGPAKQKQRIRSKVVPSHSMIFDGENSRRFFAYPGDAEALEQNLNFVRVKSSLPTTAPLAEKPPVLQSHTQAAAQTSVEVLGLDNITESVLKRAGYTTVDSIKRAPEAALLAIKGMGAKRVKTAKEAANAV